MAILTVAIILIGTDTYILAEVQLDLQKPTDPTPLAINGKGLFGWFIGSPSIRVTYVRPLEKDTIPVRNQYKQC
jgi:hypothetical protein